MNMKTQRISTITLALICLSVQAIAAEPSGVEGGTGKVKFNGLYQAWVFNESNPAANAPNTDFRMRRAEFKFSGSVLENTRWFAMLDAAKTLSSTGDNKVLQDLGVAFKLMPELEVIAGQFKILTTAEGLDSASQLLFPERAVATRAYGDIREPGLMVNYEMQDWKLGAMVSNGRGTNQDDTNSRKDLSVRLEGKIGDMLKVGAYTLAGDFGYGQKSRFGANAGLKAGDLLVRGEYDVGHDTVASAPLDTSGWYADAGYNVTEKWMPIVRVEQFHVKDGTTGTVITPAVNYFLLSHNAKIQASWSFLSNLKTAAGAPSKAASDLVADINSSVFTINFQAAI